MSSRSPALAAAWSIHQTGNHAGAEAGYRQIIATEPENASAWCHLGLACHDQKKYEDAEAAYRRALTINPAYAIAWNNLGNTLCLLRRKDESLFAYEQALRIRPVYPRALRNKAVVLLDLGRTAEAEQTLNAAKAIDPNDWETRNGQAIFDLWTGHCAEAADSFRSVLEVKPDHSETHKNLGITLLLLGRYAEGFEEYEWRLKNKPNIRVQHDAPMWDGSPLAGRTLLMEAEQGMGDTIQFVRYAAEIKRRHEGRVIVACEPPLIPLFRGLEGADQIVSQKESRPPFDVWIPYMSLPRLFQHDPTTFPGRVPYLKADPARVEKWKERLAEIKGFRIGITWQGNKAHNSDQIRSFPIQALTPLAKLQSVKFISLQKGFGSEQLETLTDFDVITLGDDFDSSGGAFLDTAAVMQNLDLVVSADTSICHVAGALGMPTWLALAFVPDWRWTLHGERTPWYPTLRLFRQSGFGDWASAFERIAQTLKAEHPELQPKLPADYRIATSGFNRLARTKHGLMLYHRHDAYTGKALNELGELLEGELEVFRQLVRPGMAIVEVGANIGAHTVPLSRLAGADGILHAIEPQRQVFQALCANVALNSLANVHCHRVAAGERPGTILVPKLNFDQPNNFAGLSLGDFKEGECIPLVTIDSLNLPKCDFLKVQVAGMELAVIRGAIETIRKFRPLLYVANNQPEKSPNLIEALLALDYKLFWHLPSYYSSANYYASAQNPFGRLVSANVLGIHASLATNIQGMKPIADPSSDWRKS